MSNPIVEAEGLVKHFGKVEALAGLDLVAEAGTVTAVLGPNGAGKTTLIRSIATLLRPEAGSLRVAGIDVVRHPERARRLIGLAGQFAAVEPTMTGRENVRMIARLFGQSRQQAEANTATVLTQLELDEVADRAVRTYSGGLRRRLDLGASLVGAPRLLLLDEPTTGLDPRSRHQLWQAIRALVAQGTDIVLTTQYLDEADQLASKVTIIDHGRVIAHGTPAELKSLAGSDVVEVRVRDVADVPVLADALASIGSEPPLVDRPSNRVTISVANGRADIAAVAHPLDGLDIDVDDLGLRRPTLDEVFMALTGSPAEPFDEETT